METLTLYTELMVNGPHPFVGAFAGNEASLSGV